MRLQLHLTPNTEPVPFNHLHQLTGALHKWLGRNDLHDGLSLYSFGWLKNAFVQNGFLHFPKGAEWNISFYRQEYAQQLLKGTMTNSQAAFGMRVFEIRELPVPGFGESYCFRTDGSAILSRVVRPNNTREYLFWDNPSADEVITHVLRQKLIKAGYSGNHLSVSVQFDRKYSKARIRKITFKNTEHKGSECPVIVSGTPEAVRFAWLVGIGDLTGSGFGGIS